MLGCLQHGFNRDSRSRRLGRSNAETLAYAMNKLQGMMRKRDVDARAIFWVSLLPCGRLLSCTLRIATVVDMNAFATQADMLCPFHNGGRPHYQSYSGGVVGATWHAAPLLDKAIIPVPWWCESTRLPPC